MLDAVERQWHTASICAAVQGGEVESWDEVRARFEEYLSDERRPMSQEESRRRALGLG